VLTPVPYFVASSMLLDCSVLDFVDTYPAVCSYLFRQISLSRDHSHFFSLALSLFVEEALWPRYARIQHMRGRTLYGAICRTVHGFKLDVTDPCGPSENSNFLAIT
jgi:hypothetical protein